MFSDVNIKLWNLAYPFNPYLFCNLPFIGQVFQDQICHMWPFQSSISFMWCLWLIVGVVLKMNRKVENNSFVRHWYAMHKNNMSWNFKLKRSGS